MNQNVLPLKWNLKFVRRVKKMIKHNIMYNILIYYER